MKKILISLILGTVWTLSCDKSSLLQSNFEELVVEAYLYAHQQVNDVHLTQTIALGSGDTLCPPVNDAEVSLVKDGQTYDLVLSDGDSGFYHYPGSDLTVDEGDDFQLMIRYRDETILAETTVPPAPGNIQISSDILSISETFSPFNQADDSNRMIQVTWDEEPSALFFIIIENREEDPESVESQQNFKSGNMRQFISSPQNRNSYNISRFNVTHYGQHRILVYRVNQEYADLYISRQQDSRDLNEPISNIENGLGVFSAFTSGEEVFFEVVSSED